MARPKIQPGAVIDGFTVGECVHSGGMATLWSVSYAGIEVPLLMKIPRVSEGEDPAAIVSFEMEQMILPRLSGPHVPACFGTGDFARQAFLALFDRGIERELRSATLMTSSVRLFWSIMPSFGHVLAVGALVCGLATWIFPLLRLAWPWNGKPRSSLAAVGFTIGILVIAAYFSVAGLVLALLAFVFAQNTDLAWFGLLAIAAFWVLLVTGSYIGSRRSRSQPKETDGR